MINLTPMLSAFMSRIDGSGALSKLARLSGGANMESWAFDWGGAGYVLRRAPSKDYMAGRPYGHPNEAALVMAAHDAGVKAPQVVGVLADSDGMGTGYVMRRIVAEVSPAAILADPPPSLIADPGRELARIHRLPRAAIPAAIRRAFASGLSIERSGGHRGQLAFFGSMTQRADRHAFLRHLAPVRKKRWVVYAKPPFAGPEAVLAYLSRYTHRVAISNSRILRFDEAGITFHYKDYRKSGAGRQQVMTLAADEFIRRFVTSTRPVPSHSSSLIRSARLQRNTNMIPEKGSRFSSCCTSDARPTIPLRKSTGFTAISTSSGPGGMIMSTPALSAAHARYGRPSRRRGCGSSCP